MNATVHGESLIGDEAASNGAATRKRLDPGFKRNLVIIGSVAAVALIAIFAILLRPSSAKQGPPPRSEVTLGPGQSQAAENLTPAMKAKLENKQTQEAGDAAARGQSYIPPDHTGAVQPVAQQPYVGPSSLSQGSAPVTQYAAGLNSETDKYRREGLERQLGRLMRNADGADGADTRQRFEVAVQTGRAATSAAGAAPAAAAAPVAAARRRELVPGLTIAAGELASDLKVPAGSQGFASAMVHSGPAAGAYLIGSAKVTDESLEIAFSQMRLGNKVYRIDALVLDEQTANNAIAGNVDRKILERYAFPIALAMAQGYFTAKSQTGSSLVGIADGISAVTTPPPSAEQARSAGISQGLQLAGQQVQKSAQQPIVISREKRFPVGILFRSPVLEDEQ